MVIFVLFCFGQINIKIVNSVSFQPEYAILVLHPVQEIQLKRTCKYFGVFRDWANFYFYFLLLFFFINEIMKFYHLC